MPGTGLTRTAPWPIRLAWHTVLRWLVPVLDDASTPERSAAACARLLLETALTPGEVYGWEGGVSRRVWSQARDPALAARILDESLAFLAARESTRVAPPGEGKVTGASRPELAAS